MQVFISLFGLTLPKSRVTYSPIYSSLSRLHRFSSNFQNTIFIGPKIHILVSSCSHISLVKVFLALLQIIRLNSKNINQAIHLVFLNPKIIPKTKLISNQSQNMVFILHVYMVFILHVLVCFFSYRCDTVEDFPFYPSTATQNVEIWLVSVVIFIFQGKIRLFFNQISLVVRYYN